MTNVYEATKPTTEQAPQTGSKSGCGCWIAGCLIVVLLGLVGIGIMAWLGVRFAAGQIEKYTEPTPADLPVVEYDEEQLTALQDRMKAFKQDLADDKQTEDLVLTADDINALIASKEDLKGKFFVEIEDGQVKGDVSMPLDMLPLGVGKGRYFNGSATFEVSIVNGILVVTVDEAEVKGEKVPEEFMDGIRRENIAKDVKFEADTAKTLRRIEEVVVEDGRVVLKAKPPQTKDSAPSEEGPSEEGPSEEGQAGDAGAATESENASDSPGDETDGAEQPEPAGAAASGGDL